MIHIKKTKTAKALIEPTNKERLIWLLQIILKEQVPLPFAGDCTMVELDKLLPHLDVTDPYQDFSALLEPVINDKDFYRKHNMLNYEPSCNFDYTRVDSKYDIAVFCDFTDDFLKTYLKDRLGVKSITGINSKSIKKIEIIKDEKEQRRIKVYINGKYDSDPLEFARKGNWQLMYKVANKDYVAYDKKSKEFYDYFNYRKENPLYATQGFEITKILKEEDGYSVPNIEIKLTTKNKTTRQLKPA